MLTREESYAMANIVHQEVINFYEQQFDEIFKKCNVYPKFKSFRGNTSIRNKLIDKIYDSFEKAMEHKECCLICKNRNGCKFADNVRETFGINSNEMWFSCFKTKDIK